MKVKVTARSWTDAAGKKHKQGAEVDITDRAVLHNALHSGRVAEVKSAPAAKPAADGKVK